MRDCDNACFNCSFIEGQPGDYESEQEFCLATSRSHDSLPSLDADYFQVAEALRPSATFTCYE